MGGKGNYLILLIIIGVLTLTLALMAVYIFVIANPSADGHVGAQASTAVSHPKDEDWGTRKLYPEEQVFNLKSADNKVSVIQINVVLHYFKKVNGIKEVEAKLTLHESKIKQIVCAYFMNMELAEAQKLETIDKAASDLKKTINEYLTANEKSKDDIIYDVVFEKWFCQ